MAIEVLPLIIAFAATLVGIAGNSWDKRRKGWRKLTPIGRLVVILAAASLAVSTYQARQAVLNREEQAKKENLLRNLAREDVMAAIDALVDPFKRLIDTAAALWPKAADPSAAIIDKNLYRPSDHLTAIGSQGFLKALDDISALACPNEFSADPGCTWAKMFGIAAWRGDERLKDVVARYSAVLSPAALELLQSVRSHKMLDILKSAPGNVRINEELGHKDVQQMKIGWLLRGPHGPSDHYLPFFALLIRLRDEVGAKREEPDRWWLPKSTK